MEANFPKAFESLMKYYEKALGITQREGVESSDEEEKDTMSRLRKRQKSELDYSTSASPFPYVHNISNTRLSASDESAPGAEGGSTSRENNAVRNSSL